MNIILWILQSILALHTAIGAVWKLFQSAEQTMPSFKSIPHGLWLAMSGLELMIAAALVLPALSRFFGIGVLPNLVPIAALLIAVEMLAFMGIHFFSGETNYAPVAYWLIVAMLCVFIAYGRTWISPL